MPFSLIEGAIGGIGLFLLGMRLMSDGIRTVSDARIRRFFLSCTSNRFTSFLFGIFMALGVNSGSAAVICTVGLANGGLLNTFQALNVMGGVLVGSSLMLYLPLFPYKLVATPLVLAGVLLKFFARRRRLANVGDLLLGIGLMFIGLTLLEGSFRPAGNHPLYLAFHDSFYRVPFLGAFFGSFLSLLVQSVPSSLSIISSLLLHQKIGLLVAISMATGGLMGLAAMGCLAAVGGSCIGRRVSLLLFGLTVLVSFLFAFVAPLVAGDMVLEVTRSATSSDMVRYLAWSHSIAAALAALIAVSLSGPVSRLAASTIGTLPCGTDAAESSAGYLDQRVISTPTIAIEQVRKEILRMQSHVSFMFADLHEISFGFDARRVETIRQHEKVIDSINHEIVSYLALLSRSTRNPDINFEIPGLLQTVAALEHIGDRCEDVLELLLIRKNGGVVFSELAMTDLKSVMVAVAESLRVVEEALRSGSPPEGEDLHQLKRQVRGCFEEVRARHYERIISGACAPRATQIFNDMNAAMAAIAELSWSILSIRTRRPDDD